jgi:large repetitive protein
VPVISPDGTIYTTVIGDLYHYSYLYALNPADGSEKWNFRMGAGEYPNNGTLLGADGTIYVASQYTLYALDNNGKVKWQFEKSSLSITSNIVMATDGTLYMGGYEENVPGIYDRKLYAIYTSSPGLAKSGWPMWLHDPQHTGRQPIKFAPGNAAINFLLLQ